MPVRSRARSASRRPAAVDPQRLALAAAVMLVLAAFAFWPQYLSRLVDADPYTHAHAVLGTCWLVLLIAQPLLLYRGDIHAHRTLGRVGVCVGAAFLITGVLTAHRGLTRMSPEQLLQEGYFVYLPLSMSLIFGAALLLGVVWRSVPAVHGRFMAATALPLLDPLFARILAFYFPPLPAEFLYQVPAFALAAVLLIKLAIGVPAGIAGRVAFRVFAGGVIAVLGIYFLVPYSTTWLAFALWFHSLPITS